MREILNESGGFLNRDVVLISHDPVLNHLSTIVDSVNQYAEKEYFSTETREQIALSWQTMRQKRQTCLLDCQQ